MGMPKMRSKGQRGRQVRAVPQTQGPKQAVASRSSQEPSPAGAQAVAAITKLLVDELGQPTALRLVKALRTEMRLNKSFCSSMTNIIKELNANQ
jgi:hypothetical protein